MMACSSPEEKSMKQNTYFKGEVEKLQAYFHIPGMAVVVKQGEKILYEDYFGYADLEKQKSVDSTTVFPIASVSKLFAASIIHQLVEEGKLDLDTAITSYLPELGLPASIKVKHILSHTSQGTPGNGFLYSGRFGLLTPLIEKLTNKTYAEVLNERVIAKLGLQNTHGLINDETVNALADRLANPYFPPNEKGRFDPGLSTSTGIAATARDLATFATALQSGQLISKQSYFKMGSPFKSNKGEKQAYGLGAFGQKYNKEDMVWGYGQNDCFSSLLLNIPDKELTLIILANNNLLSDPARLIYGDVTYSLFALAFLETYVFEWPVQLDFFQEGQKDEWIQTFQGVKRPDFRGFYYQKLRATALAASFMGNLDPNEFRKSKTLLNYSTQVPNDLPHDLTELHALSMLDGQGLDSIQINIEKVAQELIHNYPENPYPKVYLGFYYAQHEQVKQAVEVFQQLVDLPQTSPNWYTLEALDYLANYYEENDADKAKSYYQQIVSIGWNYDGKLTKAQQKLDMLAKM